MTDPKEIGQKGKAAYDAAESAGLLPKFKKAFGVGKKVAGKLPDRLNREGDAMELDEITRRFDVSSNQARIIRGIQKATGVNPGSALFDIVVGVTGSVVEKKKSRGTTGDE